MTLELSACSDGDASVGDDDANMDTGSDGSDANSSEDGGEATTDRGTEQLEYLTMTILGGECAADDCWQIKGVRAAATLELEDSEGELFFEIATEEYEHIEVLARTPDFAEIVRNSLAGTDCGGFDINISMEFQWQGEDPIFVQYIDNCATKEGYVTRDIIQYLGDLQRRYLKCPPRPTDVPIDWWSHPLPQRALCWYCYDECNGDEPAL